MPGVCKIWQLQSLVKVYSLKTLDVLIQLFIKNEST